MATKKWKATYENSRKYNASWEQSFSWLKIAPDGSGDAYCKLCYVTLKPKYSYLSSHEQCNKHKGKIASKNQKQLNVVRTPRIPDMSDETKQVELEFATAVTCHCAIRAIDHIGELVVRRSKGTNSGLANMKLHRTKCSGLIKNVISPALKCEVIEEVAGKKFAIIVDESTDLTCLKICA